uniref:CSON013165 protein n=1 Tax=Culicoides sonorensis TaxID=179676 RepID=A0A336M7I6_CULSO
MDCLVDIDKLIDDLEDDETSEKAVTSNTNDNKKLIENSTNIKVSPVKNEFVPVSNVFSSLNDYVNAGKDVESTHYEGKVVAAATATNNKVHHKFTNPNYAYGDNDYSTSDSEELEEIVRRRSGNDSHDASNNLTFSDTSTSSTSGTTTTSGPESLENSENENYPIKSGHHDDADQTDQEKLIDDGKEPKQQTTNIPENVSYGSCPVPQDPMSLSNTFSNDVTNFEGMSSISSMVEITSNYKKLKSDCKEENSCTINEKLERDVASLTSDFLACGLEFEEVKNLPDTEKTDKKPIGFESTMDDVSDTELESYLQELEEETQGNNGNDAEKEVDKKIEVLNSDPSTVETCEEKEIDEGDNVSKASTIEFNEMRTKEKLQDFEAEQEPIDVETKSIVDTHEEIQKPDIEPAMFQSLDSLRFADSATTEQKTTEGSSDEISQDKKSEEGPIFEEVMLGANSVKQEQVEPNSNEMQKEKEKEVIENEATTEDNKNLPSNEDTQENLSKTRPTSLDIQNVTSPVEAELAETLDKDSNTVQIASPGHTPPPTVTSRISQENDPGMTSSSSEDYSTPMSSSLNTNVNESNPSSRLDMLSAQLGKVAPYWVPDNMTNNCMQCDTKFSLIKRRHHCRSCGQLLCSACCCMKAKLEYMEDQEVRICIQCDHILSRREAEISNDGNSNEPRQPNPNNPMEYCSVIPPHQQVSVASASAPISVMVPVGVLKREGQSKGNRKDRNVIFSDGIRPGCDLTELDSNWDAKTGDSNSGSKRSKNRVQTPPGTNLHEKQFKINIKLPPMDPDNKSYIPKKENAIPPIYTQTKTEYKFTDVTNDAALITRLHTETLRFAVQRNFYVFVKVVKLVCCVNKTVINFTTKGLHHVGQDEIVILLELDETNLIPKDVFLHLNDIYNEADKGNTITELGFSMPKTQNFLGSKEHGGFLFIRPSFQCLQNITVPESPYLIGVLIHRWEVPWAKIFPLRLMLRLGALYRYYPTPHISVRKRDSVYAEIAQTIINFLADFRTYSYTIPTIRGMYIHMEDRKTSVLIPRNRYDQIMKAINNSSDHILAMAANFSKKADGHLVCIQNTEANSPEQLHSYSTQAINIQGQPRKVTGASFIVLNGALKSSSGLSGKCNIVEDGLMVQIPPAKMLSIRDALKNMKDVDIICGPVDADPSMTETVTFQWTENDLNFNIGVFSPIDKRDLSGVPSIRCHNSLLYSNVNHSIRWTEVFIIKSDDDSAHGRDPVDIPRVAEQIARNTCQALVSFLNLLAANDLVKIGLRVTLDPENVCFEAGSQHNKLAPLYMNALDNELVPTLHRQAGNLHIDTPIILELIFHILDK